MAHLAFHFQQFPAFKKQTYSDGNIWHKHDTKLLLQLG
jgi:hypothetical protein